MRVSWFRVIYIQAGYTQKNGAVSKVNKIFISHLARAHRTLSAAETVQVSAADSVRCARARWEINILLTFETAPFFCVYPACIYITRNHVTLIELVVVSKVYKYQYSVYLEANQVQSKAGQWMICVPITLFSLCIEGYFEKSRFHIYISESSLSTKRSQKINPLYWKRIM
jgi:hypothetical protein